MRVIGFNLLLLVIGLWALELVFGSWISDNRIRNLNLIVDELYVHDVESLYDNGGRGAVYRRDEHALRGEYADPASIDILTVGGSTTDQKYISEGETWQDVLRDHSAAAGRALRIANAGVDGHSTIGHLRAFEWWFPKIPGLAPRYVLFMVGLNDIHLESKREYDRIEARRTSFGDALRERSAIYGAYRTLLGIRRASERKVGHRRIDFENLVWVDEPVRRDHAENSAARRRQYANRLRGLVEATRKLGAEPIFVTQLLRSSRPVDGVLLGAAGEGSNGIDGHIVSSLFNETTLEVCRAADAICLDLAAEMRPIFEDGDFYDFSHTTPAGAAKIGDYLYRSLRDELEF